MNNKIFKSLLVLTSMGPFFLTLAIAKAINIYSENEEENGFSALLWEAKSSLLLVVLTIVCICLTLFLLGQVKDVSNTSVQIEEVKSADNQILSFIVIYLIPLFSNGLPVIHPVAIFWIALLFFVVVFVSNSYHFNPLLSLFKYRFYEVKVKGGIHFLLITQEDIGDVAEVKSVKKISSNMILYNKTWI